MQTLHSLAFPRVQRRNQSAQQTLCLQACVLFPRCLLIIATIAGWVSFMYIIDYRAGLHPSITKEKQTMLVIISTWVGLCKRIPTKPKRHYTTPVSHTSDQHPRGCGHFGLSYLNDSRAGNDVDRSYAQENQYGNQWWAQVQILLGSAYVTDSRSPNCPHLANRPL